jgi:hypothetical protein
MVLAAIVGRGILGQERAANQQEEYDAKGLEQSSHGYLRCSHGVVDLISSRW